jgi:hypothetical protein
METIEKMTQGEEILAYMRENGSITRLEAACELHIFELSSRIGELRKKGFNIISARINTHNKNGRRTHYNIYELLED